MVVPRTLTIYLQYHSIHYTTGSNVHCTELNIKQQQKTSGKRNTVVQDTPHEYPRYYTELKPLKHQKLKELSEILHGQLPGIVSQMFPKF